ncbi:MAG: hypothetical protein OXF73_09735 [Gammaproteobacteria bacterium]|nr:hypothetical protein [Gammaproteobacteria bacterium]MCY4226932.1 hypothetical protein [Gammaproteobacteria bacterium]
MASLAYREFINSGRKRLMPTGIQPDPEKAIIPIVLDFDKE